MSASAPESLTLQRLQVILSGPASAIRIRTRLQPSGGPGDKVFPPTYTGGIYATEDRRINGQVSKSVLLDSVQSQANRFELALLEAYKTKDLQFPVMKVDFSDSLPDLGEITSLETPHRAADAIIRDSLLNGKPFPESEVSKRITDATVRNATALLEFCPTALLFGTWDSTGTRGGMGNKFAPASSLRSSLSMLTSESAPAAGLTRLELRRVTYTRRTRENGLPWNPKQNGIRMGNQSSSSGKRATKANPQR